MKMFGKQSSENCKRRETMNKNTYGYNQSKANQLISKILSHRW